MLYGILRLVFFLIIYVVGLLLITNSKIIKKKLLVLISIGFIVCCPLSYLVPIENLFMSFKTPKAVFKYIGFGEIKDVTCGEESCMIVSSNKKDSYSYSIVLKTSKGYKIGTTLSYRNVFKKDFGSKYLEVYNVVNTKDYYVFGVFSSENVETHIADSENTEYKNVILSKSNAETKTYMTCGYVNDMKEDYSLTIDKQEITIKDKK